MMFYRMGKIRDFECEVGEEIWNGDKVKIGEKGVWGEVSLN